LGSYELGYRVCRGLGGAQRAALSTVCPPLSVYCMSPTALIIIPLFMKFRETINLFLF
jgi:hypothetical protein